jgi:hypothetical protein
MYRIFKVERMPSLEYIVLFQSIQAVLWSPRTVSAYTDKKENQIFLIYKEIRNGAVAKSYMTNGLLIHGEIFAHFLIY